MKEQLETMLGGVEVFLDFDSLQDMRVLVRHVRDSDVVVITLGCPKFRSEVSLQYRSEKLSWGDRLKRVSWARSKSGLKAASPQSVS